MAESVTVPLTSAQRTRFTALAQQQVAIQKTLNELAEVILLGQFTEEQIKDTNVDFNAEGIVFTPNEVTGG